MAISLSDNIYTESNKPSDARYGPYASVALAKSSVPVPYRHKGLVVGIIEEDSNGRISARSLTKNRSIHIILPWFHGISDTDDVFKAKATKLISSACLAEDYINVITELS